MKTTTIPTQAPEWFIIDADGQTVGNVATKVAHVLRGKHKVTFSPHQLCGDQIVVINVSKLSIGARKMLQKEFITHTKYFGHMKFQRMSTLFAKKPERVVELAVKGMLPKNRLRAQMLKRLHLYTGAEHNHEAQQPKPLSLAK